MKHTFQSGVDILTPETDEEQHQTLFEREVMLATLESLKPELGIIWAETAARQIAAALVVRREFTQHGLYLDLEVDQSVPSVLAPSGPLGSAQISIPGMSADVGGAGSMLFWSRGYLSMLEIWTYGDHGWPFNEMQQVVFGAQIQCVIRPCP